MIDGSDRVEFSNVHVISRSAFMLVCRVGKRVVAVRSRSILPGSEVKGKGDRGRLVLSREMAVSLGLA